MKAVNVSDLELQEVASAIDPTALTRFNFPIYAASGAASTAVVYFEVEPGKRLAKHHDGAEEVLYIVQGEGIATIGDETVRVRAGDLAVIPSLGSPWRRKHRRCHIEGCRLFRERYCRPPFCRTALSW